MENIIEVHNLTKRYKDAGAEVTALDNVSFKLPKGFDLAILGPSGSGKTTLLQLVGGLDKMTEGDVIINGQSLKKMSDKEVSEFRNKTMGFIFQMIYLQDYFTAKENIMLPMMVAGIRRKEAMEKADSLLEKVGLLHRANHLPRQLSGGEQQRVAVARALANDPQIIFADEPTGKLDKKNSEMVIETLESLSKENGMSVIIITHDENIAKRFSRIIKLENGKVKKDFNLNTK
ncbi:MAG: ABC transporter-like protein [candidate division WS6 bacterium GW2011_GWF2_39_15]|uniref:ABC transporter-like protein n=1 Tax=candidate division WS6 bacterium GW2011_GWF2_39_15 TaxID=1619100 RepID=A0A0G0Q6G2_9BACT|nr:MAG: ABC transporter-like protein [candidate division WS6 bacterium GW2011_GWF2_39_15]